MKHLIMGTAGHVDHGKTALIKKLTNIDCDTHKEEKRRGITINLGFSHFNLPSGDSIGIIDVPGHKDFISTMVGGACGIDLVLLVIAADSGIMPQTIEHFNIIKTLNIKNGIIALTKIDLVDEELAELAKLEILEMLEDSNLENAPIIGVSSVTGKGIDTLIKTIQGIIPDIEEKNTSEPFRMYIDRFFSVSGMGSIVTGSVIGGKINIGNDVLLLPGNKKKFKIRNIERHGVVSKKVVAGDRAAINITGLKSDDLKKGMVLTNKFFDETKMIDAHITVFDKNTELGIWSTVIFHAGTYESLAKIHLINKNKISGGQNAIIQIHLNKPAILLNKDKFIIRNSSGNKTIGGGIIIDSQPLHHRKRTPELIENLNLLAQGFLNENNISQLIKIELKKNNKPVLLSKISQAINQAENDIIESVTNDTEIEKYQENDIFIIVDSKKDKEYYSEILQEIKDFHSKNQILESGIEQSEFAGRLGFSKDKTGKKYTELLLKKIESEGKIKFFKNTWVLSDHKAIIDEKSNKDLEWLETTIKDYDLQKPVYEDIEKAALERNITKDKLRTYLTYLNRKHKLCFYKNEYVHKSVIDKCRPLLLSGLLNITEGLNNSEVRKLLNSTKKLTPFLISYFKLEGIIVTRQVETYIYSTITKKGKEILNKN